MGLPQPASIGSTPLIRFDGSESRADVYIIPCLILDSDLYIPMAVQPDSIHDVLNCSKLFHLIQQAMDVIPQSVAPVQTRAMTRVEEMEDNQLKTE